MFQIPKGCIYIGNQKDSNSGKHKCCEFKYSNQIHLSNPQLPPWARWNSWPICQWPLTGKQHVPLAVNLWRQDFHCFVMMSVTFSDFMLLFNSWWVHASFTCVTCSCSHLTCVAVLLTAIAWRLTFNWRITARPNHLCVHLGTISPLCSICSE